MNNYNYYEAMQEDIKNYLQDNEIDVEAVDRGELETKLNDDLWVCDSVTGNASGSYTFNRWQSEQYIKDNLPLLCEAMSEFGQLDLLGEKLSDLEYEFLDVTIRCYILGSCIASVLDELYQ